jgi:hypothetical protein
MHMMIAMLHASHNQTMCETLLCRYFFGVIKALKELKLNECAALHLCRTWWHMVASTVALCIQSCCPCHPDRNIRVIGSSGGACAGSFLFLPEVGFSGALYLPMPYPWSSQCLKSSRSMSGRRQTSTHASSTSRGAQSVRAARGAMRCGYQNTCRVSAASGLLQLLA